MEGLGGNGCHRRLGRCADLLAAKARVILWNGWMEENTEVSWEIMFQLQIYFLGPYIRVALPNRFFWGMIPRSPSSGKVYFICICQLPFWKIPGYE